MPNLTQDMTEAKPQWEDVIMRVMFKDQDHPVTVQCLRCNPFFSQSTFLVDMHGKSVDLKKIVIMFV